jgi:hypothetical protein
MHLRLGEPPAVFVVTIFTYFSSKKLSETSLCVIYRIPRGFCEKRLCIPSFVGRGLFNLYTVAFSFDV